MAATLINPPVRSSYKNDIIFLDKGNGNTYRNTNEFFFYSNNPESITNAHLADNGKFLNMATVTGNGQIYTWHYNTLGRTLKARILVYNPNNVPITVEISNYGVTNNYGVIPDVRAWESYMNGASFSISVPAGGFKALYDWTSISNYSVYGIIARASIYSGSGSNKTPATAGLYDLAYVSNPDTATSFAATVVGKHRGYGDGYYQTVQFATIEVGNDNSYKGFKFAADYGVFGGSECSTIVDPSTGASSYLAGGYGQMFDITLRVKNIGSTQKRFKIFVGSMTGYGFPFVYMGNGITYREAYLEEEQHGGYYFDVIQTDLISSGSTSAEIRFTMVVPAVASTAYVIGAHPA